MAAIPRPSPCFLDGLEKFPGRVPARWRSRDGSRLYEWDHLHGHIEVYNRRGLHLGVLDAVTGERIGLAVRGRRISV